MVLSFWVLWFGVVVGFVSWQGVVWLFGVCLLVGLWIVFFLSDMWLRCGCYVIQWVVGCEVLFYV